MNKTAFPDAQLSDHIVAYILSAGARAVPETSARRALLSIVDSLAVILAGTRSPLAKPMLEYAGGAEGPVGIIGTDLRLQPEHAALVHGTLGHAFDFDDGYPGYPVHPSDLTVSALLSMAALHKIDGRRFIRAYVTSAETQVAIGKALGIGHYERGFHATATLGSFGAVAAVATILDLPEAVLRSALGIAGSMAAGLQRNFGTMTKPLHAGLAARNGITAVELARAGVTAHEDVFGGKDGVLMAFRTEGDPTPRTGAPVFDALETEGLGLKKFPCVNAVHRPVDATLTLRAENGLTPGDVAALIVTVPPGSTRPLKYEDPRTPHEAKFSLHYPIAAALVDGRLDLLSFEPDAIGRAEVRELFPRISVRESADNLHEDSGTRGPGTRGFITVDIETKDGRKLSKDVQFAPGNPKRPFSDADMSEKLSSCARYAGLPEDRIAGLPALLMGLPDADDVAELVSVFRV